MLKTPLDESSYVFVYGTLKNGYHNNDVIAHYAGGTLVGDIETRAAYDIGGIGHGKSMIPGVCKGAHKIKGEIWDVKDLGPLDHLEGHPDFYRRELVDIGWLTPVWMYMYPKESIYFENSHITENDNGCKEWLPCQNVTA